MTAVRKLNDFQPTGIRRYVDVGLAVSVSTHQTGQFELAEVVAHGCDGQVTQPDRALRGNAFQQFHVGKAQHPPSTSQQHDDVEPHNRRNDEQEYEEPCSEVS